MPYDDLDTNHVRSGSIDPFQFDNTPIEKKLFATTPKTDKGEKAGTSRVETSKRTGIAKTEIGEMARTLSGIR